MTYKHDYDKILTRLTTILQRLNDGEALSVTELANEFNVSSRTIQRDFNERLIAFPVVQINKKWQMQDGFKIEKSNSLEDTLVLDIIEKLSENVGGSFYSRAKKLLSKIKNEEYNPIYAKLDLEDISDKLSEIQTLESTIKSKTIIDCKYKLQNNKTYDITVKPLKIVNYEGFWYLIALDNRNDELKKYYLKNISNIKPIDETFTTTKELDKLLDNSISIWFQKDVEPFDVKLYIDQIVSKYFQRKPISKTQTIESINSDGSIEINIKATSEMEILPIVKYWLPHIKVLEPKWIDDIVKKDLDKYLKKFI